MRFVPFSLEGNAWRSATLETVDTQVRTPILLGESGAQVVRVRRVDGSSWIEKIGPASEIAKEAAVLRWCTGRLPVARVLREDRNVLEMFDLPGRPLNECSMELTGHLLAETIHRMHALPVGECLFTADWDLRLHEALARVRGGLVDESDFDEMDQGRSAEDILEELTAFPALPKLRCFTHGDATLENFLGDQDSLSGIVDLARAGLAHPAQDWALALRSIGSTFGTEAALQFRGHIPASCADEALLRRFCLLDELF